MKYKRKSSGFTVVELIVVMAVIGVLALLTVPRFIGHTQKAKLTSAIVGAKELEKASEQYYMDNNRWLKLSEEAYTAEQVQEFAQRILDDTGHVVILEPEGKYYDIDFDILSPYIKNY